MFSETEKGKGVLHYQKKKKKMGGLESINQLKTQLYTGVQYFSGV